MGTFISHDFIRPETVEARTYQEVIAAKVFDKGSSLVVMPTGLGKTNVAILIIAEKLRKQPDKKILFLAPTKPLVMQHAKTLHKFLNLEEDEVGLITGITTDKVRDEVWANSKVISLTPQTLENALLQGKRSLEDISLIVFDECHRAVSSYAYTTIAREYVKQNQNPLILGLTASPGGSEERINDVCRNLFINNVEVKTHDDPDVKPYVKDIDFDWIKVDLPEDFSQVKKNLENVAKQELSKLKELGYVASGTQMMTKIQMLDLQKKVRQEINTEGRNKPNAFSAASHVAALFNVTHSIELLETQGVSALAGFFERSEKKARKGGSKALRMLMHNQDVLRAMGLTKILKQKGFEHPKLDALSDLMQKEVENNPDFKIIIFTHFRDTARLVTDTLNDLKGVKAVRFVGQAHRESDKGLSQKEQGKIVEQFKEGVFNTLVTTSVGEEGLDLPSVDMVLFYEAVPSEIRTIQRRGRTGRQSKGRYIVMIAKGTRDETYYWSSKRKEQKMLNTLQTMKKDGLNINTQTSLSSFMQNKPKAEQVSIIADMREKAGGVVKILGDKPDVNLTLKQLEVGDYILSEHVIVERKGLSDFLSSMIDGRLFTQAKEMRSNFDSPLFLIEGTGDIYSLRNINPAAIRGAITSLVIDYKIPFLYTSGPEDTAEMLMSIAKREQLGLQKEIRLRGEKRAFTLPEQQQFLVEGLPGVGPTLAKELLKHFGSVSKVFNAPEPDLKNVEKIGPIKAKEIRKIIESDYDE